MGLSADFVCLFIFFQYYPLAQGGIGFRERKLQITCGIDVKRIRMWFGLYISTTTVFTSVNLVVMDGEFTYYTPGKAKP